MNNEVFYLWCIWANFLFTNRRFARAVLFHWMWRVFIVLRCDKTNKSSVVYTKCQAIATHCAFWNVDWFIGNSHAHTTDTHSLWLVYKSKQRTVRKCWRHVCKAVSVRVKGRERYSSVYAKNSRRVENVMLNKCLPWKHPKNFFKSTTHQITLCISCLLSYC